MVNTRKMSKVSQPGEGDAQAEVLSDSSTTSSTTTLRRSSRRSVGNVTTAPIPASVPIAVATPTRRSRRLSNSSVESLGTNDTPQPIIGTRTRRTSRGQTNAASDSDTESIKTTKKRKLAEPVENLGPITEEKTEGDCPTIPNKEDTTVDVAQAQEINKEDAAPADTVQAEIEKPTISELEGNKIEAEITDVQATGDDTKMVPVAEGESKIEVDRSDTPGSDSFQSAASHHEEIQHDINAEVSPAECADAPKQEEVAPAEPELVASPSTKSPEPAKPVEAKMPAEPMVVDENEPKEAEPETTAALPPISERLLKLSKEPAPTKPKKASAGNKEASKPAKPALPCGADIMRNIPRGKCKSGREWRAPKSNPRYMYQDKGLKMPLEKITQLRQERQRIKELENRLKEEERARREEIKRRREINKQRAEENARRGEIVQVVRNTNKIKRMKKKQLKLIQKRDTTVTST